MKSNRLLLSLLISLMMIGFSSSASAVIIDEYYNSNTQEGYFDVENDGTDSVYAFAVANSTLFEGMSERSGLAGDNSAWAYAVITKEEWDEGFDFTRWGWEATTDPNSYGNIEYNDGSPLWTAIPDTTDTFETYFGTEMDKAIIYYTSINDDGYLRNNPLQPNETNRFDFYAGQLASPYVAFGINGTLVATGSTIDHTVPAPGSIFLFGFGLIGLAGYRRKK